MDKMDKQEIADRIAILKETRCKCGAKMHITQINPAGTAIDLACTRPTCGRAYHIPLTGRDQQHPPGYGHQFQKATNYTPAKEYRCKDCLTSIPKDQALRTFHETGRALCNVCEGELDNETQT